MRTVMYLFALCIGWFIGVAFQYADPSPNAGTPDFWIMLGVFSVFGLIGLGISIALDATGGGDS